MSLVVGVRWSFRGKDAGSARSSWLRARLRTQPSGRAARPDGTAVVPSSPPKTSSPAGPVARGAWGVRLRGPGSTGGWSRMGSLPLDRGRSRRCGCRTPVAGDLAALTSEPCEGVADGWFAAPRQGLRSGRPRSRRGRSCARDSVIPSSRSTASRSTASRSTAETNELPTRVPLAQRGDLVLGGLVLLIPG